MATPAARSLTFSSRAIIEVTLFCIGNSLGDLLVINAEGPETRVALIESGQLAELYIERRRERGIVGNIYKGRVKRVLPGMQSAGELAHDIALAWGGTQLGPGEPVDVSRPEPEQPLEAGADEARPGVEHRAVAIDDHDCDL